MNKKCESCIYAEVLKAAIEVNKAMMVTNKAMAKDLKTRHYRRILKCSPN